MVYNLSGFPCSDELYHHGILGQKWGIRRYQNSDGTLTALGKVHYGAVKAADAVGKGAKAVGKYAVKKYKSTHPKAMTREELQEAINRLNMEAQYRRIKDEANPYTARGKKILMDVMESSVKSLTLGAIDRFNKNLANELELENMEKRAELEDKKAAIKEAREEARGIARERRQEARDVAKERRQEARDIAKEERQDKRDEKREQKESSKMSSRFEEYVNSTMPKDFSSWTSTDWQNFDTYQNIASGIRDFEGRGQGGSGGKKKKKQNP